MKKLLLILLFPCTMYAQNGNVKTEVFTKDSTVFLKTVVTNETAVTSVQMREAITKAEEQIDKLTEQIRQAQAQLNALQKDREEMIRIVGMIEQEEKKKE